MKTATMLSKAKTSDLLAELFSRRVLQAHASNIPDNGIMVVHYDVRYMNKANADVMANKLARAINRRPGKQVIFLFVPSDQEFSIETLTEAEMEQFGWARNETDKEQVANA